MAAGIVNQTGADIHCVAIAQLNVWTGQGVHGFGDVLPVREPQNEEVNGRDAKHGWRGH